MTTITSTTTHQPLLRRLAIVLAAVAALLLAAPAQPASAAASVTPPSNLVCERYDNKLSVNPPRVWASYRTEQVVWTAQVQRWNGYRWLNYSHHNFYASFNTYGHNVTGWSTGWYATNTMNIPVHHAGYYRILSAVGGTQGGVTSYTYADGGRHCPVY